MSTPTLTVHEAVIAQNTRTLASATSGAVMAVLKANAFGHGIRPELVLANGASSLGVTSIDEALALRAQGVRAPLLSWLNPVDADYRAAILADVQLAVPSLAHLEAIAQAAQAERRRARVHLHIDVGLARDGASREEWSPLCTIAATAERRGLLDVVGVMGHLSSADRPGDRENRVETLVFGNAVRTAWRRGLTPRVRHLAATAATLTAPATHFDLSRIGAGLYGIDPSGRTALRGAMTLTAPVVSVRRVRPGTGVGYGHSHVTDRATTLALLPVGYADGVPRSATERALVQIGGRRHRVVGAVSMDQIVVDVGDATVRPGDSATLFGPGDGGEPTVHDWAAWSGTIAHDIVTGIGQRVLRRVAPLEEASA